MQLIKFNIMSKTYRESSHKWTYIWIAIKHWCTPTKVYKLAHGYVDMHEEDRPIMHDLKTHGIIHKKGSGNGHHHHHHHHHSSSK